jgi:PTH1 family peptidyl-tRNA hydrolase
MNNPFQHEIKVIIGLGNPGLKFERTRHNIGFRVVDALAQACGEKWEKSGNVETATILVHDKPVILLKPQTFMNLSGQVISALSKDGIKPENILVVHDELEQPFGKIVWRFGGSHRGHNGLRSIMGYTGPDFARMRFGIGRPEDKNDVPEYVLKPFLQGTAEVDALVERAVQMILELY